MPLLLNFLNIVLPQVPHLASMFRDAFVKVGGEGADFDEILAANQKDIDRLKDPNSFRHEPPT